MAVAQLLSHLDAGRAADAVPDLAGLRRYPLASFLLPTEPAGLQPQLAERRPHLAVL